MTVKKWVKFAIAKPRSMRRGNQNCKVNKSFFKNTIQMESNDFNCE